MTMDGGVFGHSVGRLEDAALLRGTARFTDDIPMPDTLEIAFLRSPFAHARIGRVDCAAAQAGSPHESRRLPSPEKRWTLALP